MESQMLRKKGENVFKEYLFLFSLFLLWSGSGTSRKVVSALNSRVDVTSRWVTVSMYFLWSLLLLLSRFTEIPSFYLSPVAPNSSLHNPSHFWHNHFPLATLIFIIFLFFWFLTRWVCSDAFIHFVCGSRRVNIWLGVLLLIPKSPQGYIASNLFDRNFRNYPKIKTDQYFVSSDTNITCRLWAPFFLPPCYQLNSITAVLLQGWL